MTFTQAFALATVFGHRSRTYAVTAAPRNGRFELQRSLVSTRFDRWYCLYDRAQNRRVTDFCAEELRPALAPLPVRIGMRFNVRVVR